MLSARARYHPTGRSASAYGRSLGQACTRARPGEMPPAARDHEHSPGRPRRKRDTGAAGSLPRAARTAATDATSGVPGARSAVTVGRQMRLSKNGRKLIRVPARRPEAPSQPPGLAANSMRGSSLAALQQTALRGGPAKSACSGCSALAILPRCSLLSHRVASSGFRTRCGSRAGSCSSRRTRLWCGSSSRGRTSTGAPG